MIHKKKHLKSMFPRVNGFCSPQVIGEVNDVYVKITRVLGHDVPWHSHDNEDELFYIVQGSLTMEIWNEKSFCLSEGDLFIVSKGIRHRVFTDEECWVMLIENKETKHTGNVQSKITKSVDEQLHDFK